MRQQLQRAFIGAIALATVGAMTACGSSNNSSGSNSGGSSTDKVELTIATFGEFGYEDLLPEYMKLHPNITVKHNKTGEGGPYATAMLTKLASGSGLEDVAAVEEGHLSDVLGKPQLFNNLEQIGPKDANKTPTFNAAKLNDTATAVTGIPQCVVIVKLRVALATSAGGP